MMNKTIKTILTWYFLVNTIFCIFAAFFAGSKFLMPGAILAGISFFAYLMIITGNGKHL